MIHLETTYESKPVRGEQPFMDEEVLASLPIATRRDLGFYEATPYSDGLALLDVDMVLPEGMVIRFAVRDGRPHCVAVESPEGGPPLTASLLRIKVKELLRDHIKHHTVVLETDPETGETVGLLGSRAKHGEIKGKPYDKYLATGSMGRKPLADDFLREILIAWESEKAAGNAPSSTLAKRYGVEPGTVRQWKFKAQRRLKEGNDG